MILTKYSEEQMKEIGQRLKTARMEHGLSQGQLCERARIPSTKIVSKFELGLAVPKEDRLRHIADALGVPEDYILEGDIQKKGKKEAATMAMSTKKFEFKTGRKEAGLAEIVAEAPSMPDKPRAMATVKTKKAASKKAKAKNTRPDEGAFRRKSGYAWPNSKRLKELREQGGLSLREIANFCGLTSQSVTYWERQKNRISLYDVAKLAGLYGVPVEEIALMHEEQKEQASKMAAEAIAAAPARKAAPAVVLSEEQCRTATLRLPENPEETFCKNVRYLLSKKEYSDEEFERAVGCDTTFDDARDEEHHGWKLSLGVALRTARFLGKTVEELVCDTKAAEIEAMAAEYERKGRELAAEYERKARELRRILGA